MAVTSAETFSMVGERGFRLFAASRNTAVPKLSPNICAYHDAMQVQGSALRSGDAALRFPVYVGATHEEAYEIPRDSSMNFYRMLRDDTARLFKGNVPPEHRPALVLDWRSLVTR